MEHINSLIEALNKHAWVVFSGWLLAVLGVVLSIVFYYRGKRVKKLSFMIKTFNLINNRLKKVEDIGVTYKGAKVENLSVSKFGIWNDGNETINGEDIAKNNRLRIETLEGIQILGYEISLLSNESNGIKLDPDYDIDYAISSIDVSFDYLDPNEAVVVQIYHTGIGSEQLTLSGAVRGIKNLNQVYDYGEQVVAGTTSNLAFVAPDFMSIVMYICLVALPFAYLIPIRFMWVNHPEDVVGNSMYTLFFVIGTTLYQIGVVRIFLRRIPKGFRKTFQDS